MRAAEKQRPSILIIDDDAQIFFSRAVAAADSQETLTAGPPYAAGNKEVELFPVMHYE